MDIEGYVRRRLGVAVLALLVVVPVACSDGGGEAEQKADSQDEDDEKRNGAPGEDADGDSDDDDGQAGDGGDGDGDDDNADDPGDPAADVRAAYVDYQTMFERLAVAPDSDDPEITQLTSGAELNHVVDTLTEFENGGLAVEFGDDHKHNVYDLTVGADGASATVLDCFVSDARVVNADTRSILRGDPEGGSATVVTASVVRADDGTWKVDATGSEELDADEACGSAGVISGS